MVHKNRFFSNEDYLEEIRRVAEKIGKPPTWNEFDEHAEMSTQSVMQRFGSWNEAKEQAGIETYSHYSSGEKGNPKLTKTGLYRETKEKGECLICDEDFKACLVFHHLPDEEKRFEVSKYRNIAPSVEELKREIEKCVLLCANCHRKIHSDNHPLGEEELGRYLVHSSIQCRFPS